MHDTRGLARLRHYAIPTYRMKRRVEMIPLFETKVRAHHILIH